MSMTSCDGCGVLAPPQHSSLFPADGWFHLSESGRKMADEVDVCSLACLATIVASRIAAEAIA